jgi:hypothetical protein
VVFFSGAALGMTCAVALVAAGFPVLATAARAAVTLTGKYNTKACPGLSAAEALILFHSDTD